MKFLNDVGAGEVTRIVDHQTAMVQVDDGFEVPWLINDLVVERGSYGGDAEEESEQEVDTPPAAFEEQTGRGSDQPAIEDEALIFAFVPDPNSSSFDTYLVNSSSYQLKYTIARKQEGEQVLFREGTLEAGIKINLGSYLPGNLEEETTFRIQGIFYNLGFYIPLPPLDTLIKVSATEMYDAGSRRENDYFHDKAILYTLHDWRAPEPESRMKIDADAIRKAMYTKGDVKADKKVKPEDGPKEVDLHIGELVDDHQSLEQAEILDIQMSRFRTALESAILHQQKRVVFIHGVGNGKLKHEIRRTLDKEYRSCRYQDASFREYGYGATMVIIR